MSEQDPSQKEVTQPAELPVQVLPGQPVALQWRSLVSDVPKYAVAIGFLLYTVGFLIWYSYLAQYGITPSSLLKVEFLSAALCYFPIAFGISIPAALIFERALLPKQNADILGGRKLPLFQLFVVSSVLCGFINQLFFEGMYRGSWILFLMCILALKLLIRLALRIPGPSGIRIRKWLSRIIPALENDTFEGVCFLLISSIPLTSSERTDGWFLAATALLYVSATNLNGILSVKVYWQSFPRHLKMLVGFSILFVFIGHVRLFGTRQFGRISQAVGGGEPLTAVFLFKSDQQLLPVALGIPPFKFAGTPSGTSTSSHTNYVVGFGPVWVLTKSDQEIVFLVPATGTTNATTKHAKTIRRECIQAIEFLNKP